MSHRYQYDAFISHAAEDKGFADELHADLVRAGFRIWYSGTNLKPGDDMDQLIPEVLRKCKYVIVIFSPDFLKSRWLLKEITLPLSLETTERKIIIPVWHQLSSAQVKDWFPLLGDRFAVYTVHGIKKALPEIVAALKKRKTYKKRVQPAASVAASAQPVNGESGGMQIQAGNLNIKSENFAGRDLFINTSKK